MDKCGGKHYTAPLMDLERKLRERKARVGIIGLGYVGLPLAVEFARAGFSVTGLEASAARLSAIKKGRSYIEDVPSAELARLVKAGRLSASSDPAGLARCDAVLICVQTPLRKTKEPDMGPMLSACRELAKRLRKGQLVVLESTTFPGATEEIVKPALEESGLKAGRDFHLAFSPERVDPGNPTWKIANTPKVVGGVDKASTELAAELYRQVITRVVPVSSATSAELVKLLENSFRAVNIALVNEIAQACHRLGVDVWEVVGAAATKPFGFMPFWPGPGIGGHCIPKDPQLLSWKLKTLSFEPRFIELATVINGAMPAYAAIRAAKALNADGKSVKGSRILVLGVAYKPGVSDFRDSPALDAMHLLAEDGARVEYHDPHVPTARVNRRVWRSKPLTDAALKSADLVVIMTAHREIDYKRVCRLAKRVFDTRNATAGLAGRVEKL